MKAFPAALFLGLWCALQAPALTLMSYNVENLFDDVRNGTEYRQFVPGRAWSTGSFLQRVQALSEVVRKSVPGGADILLLQEIENENALRVFLEKGARGMGYNWHVLVAKKGLSANVAIVSRLPIARVRTHAVGPWKASAPVRDILEAQVETGGHLLYVFNNHWKSRTEGLKATEPSRRESAAVLARRIAEILVSEPDADIVAAGDLNESVDEYDRRGARAVTALMPPERGDASGTPVLRLAAPPTPGIAGGSSPVARAGVSAKGCLLFDPWLEMAPALRGSSSWRGEWLTSDHILLSAGLFDREGFRYRAGSFAAVKLPFLLDDRGFPRRWSPRAAEGFSDHLPVLVTLEAD